MGRHAMSLVTFFFIITMLLTGHYAIPGVIYPECYGFERALFTLRRFLPYTPSCQFQGLPGSDSLTLRLVRLCVWARSDYLFESQQSTKRVIVVGLFKAYGQLITRIICFSRDLNPFHDKLSMSKALSFIRLATDPHCL